MISGKTTLLPLFGYPTEAFKAPLIYNPWFQKKALDVVVVPMGVKPDDFSSVFRSAFQMTNIPGALITMPHKVSAFRMLDEVSTTAEIAGSCNAVRKRADGALVGDMFDGAGFCRGLACKGFVFSGAKCLVVGSGGVGAAIAASLAANGVGEIRICDLDVESAESLASRLCQHYPELVADRGVASAAGYDLVVNATPLGLPGDPLPMDISGLTSTTWVGEVVMKVEMTPLLQAARRLGCKYQIGSDMLFEMIPSYLEFFGYGKTTAEELRSVAQITY